MTTGNELEQYTHEIRDNLSYLLGHLPKDNIMKISRVEYIYIYIYSTYYMSQSVIW